MESNEAIREYWRTMKSRQRATKQDRIKKVLAEKGFTPSITRFARCSFCGRMAKKAGNLKAMNGAVAELTRLLKHEVDVLQSLGVLHEEPERIDAQIRQLKPTTMPWEQIPEIAAEIERLKERFRKEKQLEDAQRVKTEKGF